MGVIIYPSGSFSVMKDGEEAALSDRQVKKIESIKDGWGGQAFCYNSQDKMVKLYTEIAEGSDPSNDAVMIPLDKLLAVVKEEGLVLDGSIQIDSDWNDYDNVTVAIKDGIKRTYNTEIYNATDEELAAELRERGYTVERQYGENDEGEKE